MLILIIIIQILASVSIDASLINCLTTQLSMHVAIQMQAVQAQLKVFTNKDFIKTF